jgi:hypothetical protein
METLLSERPARLLTVGARVTPAERQALEFEAQRRGFRNISDFTRAALGAFLTADSTPTQGEVLPCQTRN